VNQLDALLLILLVAFALRGWWRGFCRESLALAGLFGGALAAAALGPQVADEFVTRQLLPPPVARVVGWGAVFLATWIAATLLGLIADRLARALFLGGVNRFAGALFGGAKGAALAGFALLLAEHSFPSPMLTRMIGTSMLGRPLEQMAGSVVATGRELGVGHAERRV
jgi:membrane protein required for colicin V production